MYGLDAPGNETAHDMVRTGTADVGGDVGATASYDGPALCDLVQQHGDALLSYVLRWTQDPQLAEDVVQETWVRAWRHRSRLVESRGSVRGWLMRVAHNVAVDHFRARRVRPAEAGLDAETDAECLASDQQQQRVLDAMVVQQVLALASPALRQTLVEVYLRDQTVVQAAERLGVPVGTVKSRLYYGLRELRSSMEHESAA
jgi:RNA polymerase sigma-70 factor (ECF subfamily)